MASKMCGSCVHHQVFIDEMPNGSLIHDGCLCRNKNAGRDAHFDNCYEYGGNAECQYWEGEEDED